MVEMTVSSRPTPIYSKGKTMSKHNDHLPRNDKNKAAEGMDDRKSGGFGRVVAKAQGTETKQDAKDAKAGKK